MRRKRDIITTPWFNAVRIKIGPDEVRRGKDICKDSVETMVSGVICDVGIDYVNLLQDDHKVFTVLTDRITKVIWVDPKCKHICSQCHEHKYHNSHCNRHEHCSHCHRYHHHHNDCGPRFTCFCDHVIPFCDNRIELRLAGLNDTVHFDLFRHKGCKVKLEIS